VDGGTSIMAELSRGQILKNPEVIGAGTTGGKIRLLDGDENSHIDLKVPDTVGTAYTFTLPDSAGTTDYYLKTDGQGNTSWAEVTGVGGGTPGGSTNQLQYNNAGSFAGAAVTTDGTNLYVTGGSELRFNDSDNSNHVGFAASEVVTANVLYKLPDTVGTAGQVLKIASDPSPTSTSASLIWQNDNSGGAGANPGGVDTYIQFNDAGTFGGDAGFTYNKTTDSATLVGSLTVGGVDATTGTDYKINGTSVLTSTTLGSGVVNSSLTSVGTLTILTVDNISIDTNTVSSSTGDIILDPATTNPVRISGGSPLRLFGSTTTNNYVGLAVPATITGDYTITLPAAIGSANEVLQVDGTGNASFVSNTRTLNFVIDGGGSVITTGKKGVIVVDGDYTVTGWTIIADQSGSIVVDVNRATYTNFPTTASIAGTELPTLSSVQKNEDLTLSSWTTTLSARDILEFEVDSVTTVTRVTVALRLVPR
jgi:hypothetical protein